VGEAVHIFAEYVQRKRLAKLGYTSNIDDLESWKAEAFIIIDTELDACQNREMKKAAKRG